MPRSPADTKPPQKKTRQTAPTLVARIQSHWAQLPSSEQRIAEFLLNSPGTLVSHTAGEIADLAETSKAAVTRLIQRLGYVSFTAARQQARAAQDWGSPLYLENELEPTETSLKGRLAQQFRLEQTNLEQTWNAQTEVALNDSIHLLAQASRVALIGFRNSAFLANYMAVQLGLLRSGVSTPTPSNDSMTAELCELSTADLAVVVAFRRRVALLPKTLQIIRQRKIPLLLITDSSGLALAEPSDLVIVCKCQSRGLFDSYSAPMSVINFLLGQVAATLGEGSRARLRDIETLHVELQDLV
ncbi:MurR/RpiR family transcriptional regulator [Orrella daihaiensis]|uniref:MurR/RpiR family transcriptional regulator n=1 Tax=Orrella daihaiensis TaxID=2782176 RepID=A0ABY4AL08_9BURK|nr:MurR/RpiR family transcriptional regulator [Orrella daihaiensis]UOD50738.1 MurR/RpiR family transcriptional regulator [Orrella daihaiensis]